MAEPVTTARDGGKQGWSFLTSHGIVLLYVAANPNSTVREMSDALGITERQVLRILKNLTEAEVLRADRTGRRNSYTLNAKASFRHPTISHVPLQAIVEVLASMLRPVKGQRTEGPR